MSEPKHRIVNVTIDRLTARLQYVHVVLSFLINESEEELHWSNIVWKKACCIHIEVDACTLVEIFVSERRRLVLDEGLLIDLERKLSYHLVLKLLGLLGFEFAEEIWE